MSLRPATSTDKAMPAIEGAGVHLHRAFGFHDPKVSDPFLLFDDFRNDNPEAYLPRISMAPTSWHRNNYLCFEWNCGAH